MSTRSVACQGRSMFRYEYFNSSSSLSVMRNVTCIYYIHKYILYIIISPPHARYCNASKLATCCTPSRLLGHIAAAVKYNWNCLLIWGYQHHYGARWNTACLLLHHFTQWFDGLVYKTYIFIMLVWFSFGEGEWCFSLYRKYVIKLLHIAIWYATKCKCFILFFIYIYCKCRHWKIINSIYVVALSWMLISAC